MLNTDNLSIPPPEKHNNEEYKPYLPLECVIDIQAETGEIKKSDLYNLFDYEWRSKYQSAIYGRAAGRWTFALSGDSPETYDRIQVAINLLQVFNEEDPHYEPDRIERYFVELEKRLENYPYRIDVGKDEFIGNAVDKAKPLVELYKSIRGDVVIILQSDTSFDGVEAWNTLLSVGLDWGDGDLFHWHNYESGYGDQCFFTV